MCAGVSAMYIKKRIIDIREAEAPATIERPASALQISQANPLHHDPDERQLRRDAVLLRLTIQREQARRRNIPYHL